MEAREGSGSAPPEHTLPFVLINTVLLERARNYLAPFVLFGSARGVERSEYVAASQEFLDAVYSVINHLPPTFNLLSVSTEVDETELVEAHLFARASRILFDLETVLDFVTATPPGWDGAVSFVND